MSLTVITTGHVFASILFCYLYAVHFRSKVTALNRSDANPARVNPVYMGKKCDFAKDWWAAEDQLSLEFRAVLSKEWLCATHSSRFQKPGDYHSLTIGKYPILLVMGKDRAIRGFHDVCRHRAYKVTRKPTGSTLVFGCRYHGWSYDTTGALVRAPEFEKVATFRWTENGLLPVNTQISPEGFVFVNFSWSGEELHFQSDSLKHIVPSSVISPEAIPMKAFELDGEFNWKLPAKTSFASPDGMMSGTSLSLFPTTSIFWSNTNAFWVSIIHEPISSKRTHIRFDMYACASPETIPERVIAAVEDHAGSYVQELEQLQGRLDGDSRQQTPLQESLIAFQNEVRLRTSCHSDAEQMAGKQLQSVKTQRSVSKQGLEDDLFCKQIEQECAGLSCGRGGKDLAW